MKYYKQYYQCKPSEIMCITKIYQNGNGIDVYNNGETKEIYNLEKYIKLNKSEYRTEITKREFESLRKKFILL